MIMRFVFSRFVLMFAFVLFYSCGDENNTNPTSKLFEKISGEQSGITFVNVVPENDTLNQFTYHYLFNGNGVGIGDINNDGLNDVFVSSNFGTSKLYLNKGNFKFEDITQKAGVQTNSWMTGVELADVNNDGWLDIYVVSSGPSKDPNKKKNLLFINQKNSTFKEEAEKWGLDNSGNTSCASFFDFDNDGDLDVYVGNHGIKYFSDINIPFHKGLHMDETSKQAFYENKGDHFEEITTQAGMLAMGYCLSAIAGDFNNDGWQDIYICNDYHVPDYCYINQGNGTFKDECFERFKHFSNNSMGSDIADVNGDGKLDLITLDMLPESPERFMRLLGPRGYDYVNVSNKNGYGPQYMKNTLQINSGDGYFSDLSYLYGVARTDWSWSPLFCDFDADGRQDLFVTNGYYRDVTDLDFVMFQNRKEQTTGTNKISHKEVLDRLPFEPLQNYLLMQGNEGMINKAASLGLSDKTLSTGSAYGDLNGDGRPDLIVCNQGDTIGVYKNKGNDNHFINIKLVSNSNKPCEGSKVIFDKKLFIYQRNRGYLSSSDPTIHIGLGKTTSNIPSFTVTTVNGKSKTYKVNSIDKTITVNIDEITGNKIDLKSEEPLFSSNSSLISFKHHEQETPDFKRDPLLPHRYTMLGPGSTTGDVNGDGLVDVFVGNGASSNGAELFLQNAQGNLISARGIQPWKNLDVDITGCLLFDADNDGDLDLYVGTGGAEFAWPNARYTDHLYLNRGNGTFTDATTSLPNVSTSTASVCAGDYDNDGDLDLFVTGRILPGYYPFLNIRSYLLKNENGKFIDATSKDAPLLQEPGMMCEAIFCDYNNDNWLDLVMVGEYTPVVFLKNNQGKFDDQTKEMGTSEVSGWYNSICAVDIDNDNDLDFVVGNKGYNSFICARSNEPVDVFWSDLDNNGRHDFFMSYTKNGNQYPMFSMDEMVISFPSFLSKKFTTYSAFSGKTMVEIFGQEHLKRGRLKANEFGHLLLINNGSSMTIKHLPFESQISPINGMIVMDINEDGFDDIIGVGNNQYTRVTHGPDDAHNGFVLINKNGKLQYSDGRQNGFYVPGDGKSIAVIPKKKDLSILAFQNNEKAIAFNPSNKLSWQKAPKGAVKAEILLKNGTKRARYIGLGGGYWSANAPGVIKDKNIKQIIFFNKDGGIVN